MKAGLIIALIIAAIFLAIFFTSIYFHDDMSKTVAMYCAREGAQGVYSCEDGSLKMYIAGEGGFSLIKSDGNIVKCPVIEPYLKDDCTKASARGFCSETNLCGNG